MPLVPCPDCGREVSTAAPACPQCGRPSPAATTPIVTPTQAVREETLWQGAPSSTLLIPQIVALIAVAVGIPLFTRFFASTARDAEQADGMIGFGWVVTGVIVLVQLIALAISWIRLRSTRYTLTNQRVIVETGILSKTVDEIDMRYVADTQFMQTFPQRILGIGNVTVISSDANTPRYMLRSVKGPREIREVIRAASYEISQRQVFTRST
jgi:uncharacterized membrane protein YdbT with pleckstrin-like domain